MVSSAFSNRDSSTGLSLACHIEWIYVKRKTEYVIYKISVC